jgi:polysaccharide export outer membrane protein
MKFSGLLAVALSALLAACTSTGNTVAGAPPADMPMPDAYKIGVDDVVQVSVWRNPELGITAPVRPDGMISVPLVGDVQAGGRVPAEVAKDIQTRLAAFVVEPQVAVILTELRSHEYLSRVRVTGAVRQPISIPYRQGMTVLDAVLAAGGVTEFAAADRSNLYRQNGEKTGTYQVRLDSVLNRGDRARLTEARGRSMGSASRIATGNTLLAQELDRLNRVAALGSELANLTRNFEVNRNLYQDLLERRENARLSMNLDAQRGGLNFRIQEPAAVPLQSNGLSPTQVAIGGLLLAIAAPLLLLAGWFRFDPRVRMPMQIEQLAGLPVLGSIPSRPTGEQQTRSTQRVLLAAALMLSVPIAYALVLTFR